ncbi:hypothetical protein TKK_0005647 [Trichogramma kaykai]|uniref:DNA repair and recombination protein RAD54-like n=1 Tax=Trichogramma kaykai TaxID=54128 RepID=A0ABD2XI98_9HYME
MNRNNRSGGIKFRELDYKKSSPYDKAKHDNNQRKKENVLKLFAAADLKATHEDLTEKENANSRSPNFSTLENGPTIDENIDSVSQTKIDHQEDQGGDNREEPIKHQAKRIKLDNINENSITSPKQLTPDSSNHKLQTNQSVQQKCINSDTRIYNVMIGKISTRKHKQWEDDGILEVRGKSAILKDVNGKFIGKTTVKPEMIEEGFRICMSGKEIEIVELASSQETVDVQTSDDGVISSSVLKPPIKKVKTSKGFIPVKSSSLHFNFEPLIMPNPTFNIESSIDDVEQKLHEVSVDGCLVSALRPHQREGIIFMYKCVMGMADPRYKGAILADEMGLGKTLQCITLVWTLLKKGPTGKPVIKRALIVAPSSLCGNWNKEFRKWLGSMKISPYVVEGKQKVKDFKKTPRACVMIISYEMFIRNVEDINDLKFDLLICDEGHRLKNSEVKTLKSLSQLSCEKRILLTGTPVQNDLEEFYTLANFVSPGILGSFHEYKSYYENPIVVSQRATADEEDIELGQSRAKELHERSKIFILRRTNNLINQYLPQKHELVIFCRLTKEQDNLYELITDYWFNRTLMDVNVMPLAIITALKKVCNHPYLFTSEKTDILNEILPNVPTNLSAINTSFQYSSKFKVVQAIIQDLKRTSEKLVLISYFTQTLDLLEKICCTEGLQFCRLDGSTNTSHRTKLVEKFNSKDNNLIRIFLLSAKAGGTGLNLIGASRLILFDSDWNPANDAQAMARIWRDGQKRSVYIYRLLTTGTIEEKIYQRQISKTSLSEAVVDANHISSLKLSKSELKDLFSLDSKTISVTHDLMDCSCSGSGEIPSKEQEILSMSENSRDCQFSLKKKSKQQITINQLLCWQHFKQPINSELLQDLMLSKVNSLITFIFKNSVEK